MSLISTISRKTISTNLYILNRVLHFLEGSFCQTIDTKLPNPPIFIIGAPRSGSTLLSQVLINRYEFTHLTNVHSLLYGAVSFVERCFGPSWEKGGEVKYVSQHGCSRGKWAPSECGEFWYRWFRRFPPYTPAGEICDEKLDNLRKVVAALGRAGKRPMLFKNLFCSLRLRPLVQAFPESLFIVIKRDPLRIGESLLACRKEVNGNYNKWWSVSPPEYEYLKQLAPPLQVIGQTKAIYRLIESDSSAIGKERFLNIDFEAFCDDVHSGLNHIEDFLNSHGIKLQKHGEVPGQFISSIKNREVLDSTLFKELEIAAKMDLDLILSTNVTTV